MRLLTWVLFLLVSVPKSRVQGLVSPVLFSSTTGKLVSKHFALNPYAAVSVLDADDDDEDCDLPSSPATTFGSPIDQETKERNRKIIHTLKGILFDNIFAGPDVDRAFARFYALETIARVPYFSYLSVLHLFETLGLWRKADYLRVHFAESWNELHHLLIMEELGGSARWIDRFVAQHIAFFYYWIVVGLYLANPTFAYNLNQSVEEEAFQTYDNFLNEHEDYLKNRRAPTTAVRYYTGEDLYLFDKMHLSSESSKTSPEDRRRVICNTLYDCFAAIRDDEREHVKTMAYLQADSCESTSGKPTL